MFSCHSCGRNILTVENNVFVTGSFKWKCRCGIYGEFKEIKVDHSSLNQGDSVCACDCKEDMEDINKWNYCPMCGRKI